MATQPPHRRIGIRRATAADVDAITQIFFDAFSRSVMTRLMHPKGPSADARAKFAASLFPAEGDADGPAAKSEPGETIIMVAELLPGGADGGGDDGDDEQGEIVAFAKWWIAREPRSEAEWNVDEPMTAETVGEGVELDVKQRFIGGIHEMRRRWVRGDPAVGKFPPTCCEHVPGSSGALPTCLPLSSNTRAQSSHSSLLHLDAAASEPGRPSCDGASSWRTGKD